MTGILEGVLEGQLFLSLGVERGSGLVVDVDLFGGVLTAVRTGERWVLEDSWNSSAINS
jgi:hypothetical protein